MNKPLQNELWENIRTFAFDDPASDFPFSKKLQKENNWSINFTSDAIEEYRKFIFLCCILPGGASPSDTVDKVWHLHLTYTTDYWIAFCQKTLHKEIHHFPSKGGNKEQEKHANWYQQTLEKYEEVFGFAPPPSIWPPISLDKPPVNFEIYDPGFLKKVIVSFTVLTILLVFLPNLFHTKGKDFLVYYFLLMAAGITASWLLQQHKSKKLDQYIEEYFPAIFSSFQIANFLYGPHRAYQTALVDLLKRDIIDTSGNNYKLTTQPTHDPEKEENPLVPALTENITVGDTFTYRQGLTLIDNKKIRHPSFEQLTALSKKVDYKKLIVPGIVLAIGIARLFQGMANQKPVNYLVAEIGFFSLISLMIAAQYSYTYLVVKKSGDRWRNNNNNCQSSNILNNFTILGVGAVAGFAECNALTNVFELEDPQKRSSSYGGDSVSSCSSGGGDGGGGGCGGGCGGCGGGD